MTVVEQQGGLLAAMWRPLRLETLVTLRWLAFGGQTMGVLFVQFGLGFPLPLGECLSLIALLGIVNVILFDNLHDVVLMGHHLDRSRTFGA